MQQNSKNGENWSSRFVFFLAAVGSAVGLGNFWRFPFQAGENGGGGFVLTYILCTILIALPVLFAELLIGRRGRGSAVHAVANLCDELGVSRFWTLQGWLGMTASFLILSFYSLIAGWLIAFTVIFLKNLVAAVASHGLGALFGPAFVGETPEQVRGHLNDLLASPLRMISYHLLFALATGLIVARGIKKGIEGAVSLLMPAFFVLFTLTIIFSLFLGDTRQTIDYLFNVRWDDLSAGFKDGSIIAAAMGQAFFSISLGSALMITYGSYMSKDMHIPSASLSIAATDTVVALLAGLAIFPVVFIFGLRPDSGPTLLFATLPLAYSQMHFGALIGLLFFLLSIFAAISSSIALLETVVAWADEKSERLKRPAVALLVTGLFATIGIFHALSQVPVDAADTFFNSWVPFDFLMFKGQTILDMFNSLTGNVIMPLAGVTTAIFAGWIVSKEISREELALQKPLLFHVWFFLVRFVCPAAVGIILLYAFAAPFFSGQ